MTQYTLADIAAAHTRAQLRVQLRRAVRYIAIDDTVAVNGGLVTRPKSRLIRYEVDGLLVKHFTGKQCVDKMLVYLELETEQQQRERMERVAECMEAESEAA